MKKKNKYLLVREEKVGAEKFKVRVEETEENGTRRIRTWCRRKGIAKEDQIRDWDDWEDAISFALKLSESLRRGRKSKGGKVRDVDSHTLGRLKSIWSNFTAAQIMGEKIPVKSFGTNQIEERVSLEKVFDAGIMTIKALNSVNSRREDEGLAKYDLSYFLNNFQIHATSEISLKSKTKMRVLIEDLRRKKLGKFGGRGNVELAAVSKKEWSKQLDRLNSWIGEFALGDEPGQMINVITNMINQAVVPDGKRNSGQPLAPLTKEKIAEKASQFGGWLEYEGHWEKNHFARLQKDFGFVDEREVTTFSPEEVEALFKCATKAEYLDLIPYLSFLFFAGCRPQEIGDPNKKERRFPWEWTDGWRNKSDVTGGILFTVKKFRTVNGKKIRISKWHRTRQADMSANGVAWVRWWTEQKGLKELPTTGDVPFDRDKWEKLRKEAGKEKYWDNWSADSPRHSFTSYAHWNPDWKVVEDYWHRKCGHREETYEKYYDKKMNADDCKSYFEIIPEKLFS